MFRVKVKIEGDEELLRKLADAPRIVRQELEAATAKSLAEMQREIGLYPAKPEIHMEFVSEKQRRFFFWALEHGKIEVPYRRTEVYGKSWLYKVESVGARVEGILGTNKKYAPYVRGPWQPKWMRHWKQLTVIVEESLPKVKQYFEQAGKRIAERLRR